MTHDYKRNGTTSLYAALEIATGKVIGHCYPQHRHQEFLDFLNKLDREYPRGLELHVVLDNSQTHHARGRALAPSTRASISISPRPAHRGEPRRELVLDPHQQRSAAASTTTSPS